MLARQYCIRQASKVGFAMPPIASSLRPTTLAPSWKLQNRRQIVTSSRSKETVGVSAILDVNNTPTIVPIKDPLQADKAMMKKLRIEYRLGLQDPWKLAQAVTNRLRKDRPFEAIGLVRIASRDMQVPAGWNLIMEYQLSHQRLNAAFKLYNEMKKRGQLPNAQTYTTLFRGCARSNHRQLAVAETVKLYMTMLNSTRVPPNVIHLNAALEVCARSLDIDAMMSIANTIDNKARKPDALTYATILNGLRGWVDHQAERLKHGEKSGYTREEHNSTIEKTIEQARRIWDEAIRKWNSAQIVMDEGLVFSMGRMLTLGPPSVRMEVFPLLHQAMGIPRLDSNVGQQEKTEKHDNMASSDDDVVDVRVPKSPSAAKLPARPSPTSPVPTTKTLSLILSALHRTRLTQLALRYWQLMTNTYGIVPDGNNWYALLSILRKSHSSAQTVAVLDAMPPQFLTVETFRLAFKTCLLDNVNPNVTQNSDRIYDKMVSILDVPDLECVRMYVDVAALSRHKFRLARKKAGDDEAARAGIEAAYAEQVLNAIDHLWASGCIDACRAELIARLAAAVKPHSSSTVRGQAKNYCMEILATCRKLVSAWDRVITERMLPEHELERHKSGRDILNRFVTEYYNTLRRMGLREDEIVDQVVEDEDEFERKFEPRMKSGSKPVTTKPKTSKASHVDLKYEGKGRRGNKSPEDWDREALKERLEIAKSLFVLPEW